MKLSSLFACFTSFSLISGAVIPASKAPSCSNLNSLDIDVSDEDTLDSQKVQQLNNTYNQNVDCVDASFDQNQVSFASMTHIITQASTEDYATAMKALANYMRAVSAVDADNTFKQNFVNVSLVYLNELPASFKLSEKAKRDFSNQIVEKSHKVKHRFSSWFRHHVYILKSKIKHFDKSAKTAFKSDAKFVRKNFKHFTHIMKRHLKDVKELKEDAANHISKDLHGLNVEKRFHSGAAFVLTEILFVIANSILALLSIAISIPVHIIGLVFSLIWNVLLQIKYIFFGHVIVTEAPIPDLGTVTSSNITLSGGFFGGIVPNMPMPPNWQRFN